MRGEIDEAEISRAIAERFLSDFRDLLNVDVAVVGAGPSGLTAARYLARAGIKVAVFERNLHVGGGMWGGGILFPKIAVQEEAKTILEEVGVKTSRAPSGLHTADAVEAVCKLAAGAIDAGARVVTGLAAEDVVVREERVCGVVLNWKAVQVANMHVDPIAVKSRVVVDATGHEASIASVLQKKLPDVRFPTRTGGVVGEGPMWAEKAERMVVENTREVWPGLVVAGMAANAVFGSPRMGAIFGGMLLSGKRAAEICAEILKGR